MLRVDAMINLLLGTLLLIFLEPLVRWLGLPLPVSGFYSSILGGVLVGISLALGLQALGRVGDGLGLSGAIAINLCGAAVLCGWLVLGELALTTQGTLVLWSLIVVLAGVSAAELRIMMIVDDN